MKSVYKVVGRAADLRRRLLADEPAPERDEPGVQDGQRAVEGHEDLVSFVMPEATATVAAETAEPILRLRGVGRRFGGVQAVRDVDLDVAHGERRAILGPNGAGKTTLFNLIAGDFAPTSGTIDVMGTDVTLLPARVRPRLGVARTYQKSRLFPGLDGRGQPLPRHRGTRRRAPEGRQVARAREGAARARPRRRRARLARRLARHARRLALARPAAPARGRHGERDRPEADDARRARLRALARRARAAHRAAALAAART